MTKKKVLVLITAVLVLSACFVAVLFDAGQPSELPATSAENNIILASDGCCFWVEDIRITLRDNNGAQSQVCSVDRITEREVFKYDIPNLAGSPLTLYAEFRVFYDEECSFSRPVLEFEDVIALKKTGVLLRFHEGDDMYLNVIAGDYLKSYQMGSADNRWLVTDNAE